MFPALGRRQESQGCQAADKSSFSEPSRRSNGRRTNIRHNRLAGRRPGGKSAEARLKRPWPRGRPAPDRRSCRSSSARWSNLALKVPTPAVADLSSTIRFWISASGICACTRSHPGQPGRASKPRICPRRDEIMPLILAVASEGTAISTAMTGSSSTGRALRQALAHGDAPGLAEGHVRGIDRVIGAVDQADADIDHVEPKRA